MIPGLPINQAFSNAVTIMKVALARATSLSAERMSTSTRKSCLPACITFALASKSFPLGGRIKDMLRSVVADSFPSGRIERTATPAAVSASEARTPP